MRFSPDRLSLFVEQLTAAQSALYGYIHAALANGADVSDVLQETNRVLWKKAESYDFSRPFLPWAFRVAHFEVLAFRKRQNRDRLVFDEELLEKISEEYARQVPGGPEFSALEACLAKLTPEQRNLVESRYTQGQSVAQIAHTHGKAANAVSALLYRIRTLLAECIAKEGAEEEPA